MGRPPSLDASFTDAAGMPSSRLPPPGLGMPSPSTKPSTQAAAGRRLLLKALEDAPIADGVGAMEHQLVPIERALDRKPDSRELTDFVKKLEQMQLFLGDSRMRYENEYSWLDRHWHHFGLGMSGQQDRDHEGKKKAKSLLHRVAVALRKAKAKLNLPAGDPLRGSPKRADFEKKWLAFTPGARTAHEKVSVSGLHGGDARETRDCLQSCSISHAGLACWSECS